MRVLVTRPAAAGQRTAEKLQRQGHEPHLLPLFAAQHLDLTDELRAMPAPSGIILTSAEGIRAFARYPSMISSFSDIPVFAVGKATARAACGAGFTRIKVGSGYGADLAELIRTHVKQGMSPLLYVAGTPRSPTLEQGLDAARIPVCVWVAYRMEPIAYDPPRVSAAMAEETAVLLYSKEAASRMVQLLQRQEDVRGLTFYCLSPAIAAALPGPWASRIHIAPETSEDALLSLLGSG